MAQPAEPAAPTVDMPVGGGSVKPMETGSDEPGAEAEGPQSEEDSGKDTEYSHTSSRMSKSRPSACRSSGRKAAKLAALRERMEARGGIWEDSRRIC